MASWRHQVTHRPSSSTFVKLLEGANPDIATLEELTGFDENSEQHTNQLHLIFGYKDNTLFGMRENETLVLIEVFDKVGVFSLPRLATLSLSLSIYCIMNLGFELFA